MYVKELWQEGVDWIHLAEVRDRRWAFVNTVITNNTSNYIKVGEFIDREFLKKNCAPWSWLACYLNN
jgi:hypothetical protein